MADQFTSVQWDRDEEPADARSNTSIAEVIHEESSPSASLGLHENATGDDDDDDDDDDVHLHDSNEEGVGLVTDVSRPQTRPSLDTKAPPASSTYIETTVSTPITEYDGQNHYISYLVETKTNNPQFKSQHFSTRRRFSDFNFLYMCLSGDLPTCIIPPLPNKERLEYIKGGRFAERFTNKRAVSLNTFLSRISKHPVLKNAKIYHIFLEDSNSWNTYKQNLKITKDMSASGVNGNGSANPANDNLEAISDYIMNAFKKPAYESKNAKEFQEILTKSNKLQDNIGKIEKIYQKVTKKQSELVHDFDKFGREILRLNRLLATDFKSDSSKAADTRLSQQFEAFHENIQKVSEYTTTLNENIDYHYLTSLKDLDHYISQLRHLIKLKDAKSLDFEMLSSYLDKAEAERHHLIHGGSVTSSTEGAIGFLSKKLESITSGFTHTYPVAQGNATNDRVAKLNVRIEMLQKEKTEAFEMFQTFENDILSEYALFDTIKNEEIQLGLQELSTNYLEYYTNVVRTWQPIEFGPEKEDFETPVASKLKADDPLFENGDVTENNATIAESVEKLQEQKQLEPLPQPPVSSRMEEPPEEIHITEEPESMAEQDSQENESSEQESHGQHQDNFFHQDAFPSESESESNESEGNESDGGLNGDAIVGQSF